MRPDDRRREAREKHAAIVHRLPDTGSDNLWVRIRNLGTVTKKWMVIRRVSDLRSLSQHNGIAIYGIGTDASASVTPLTALQMAYGASISVNESYHDISTSLSTSCYYCCHCHAYGSPSSGHLPLVHCCYISGHVFLSTSFHHIPLHAATWLILLMDCLLIYDVFADWSFHMMSLWRHYDTRLLMYDTMTHS